MASVIKNGKSPFNSYDFDTDTASFKTLNTQLNAEYKEVFPVTYTANEMDSFFLNKEAMYSENVAKPCDIDPICDKNIL